MGLTSFKTFCGLPQRFKPQAMGFACDIGTINRLSARMGLAKSFQGIQLDVYKEATIRGYNALFRVFLTHSALECFCEVYGYSTKWPKMVSSQKSGGKGGVGGGLPPPNHPPPRIIEKIPKMGQDLAPVITHYDPAPVMQIFRERDNQDKLYGFLQKHLTGKRYLLKKAGKRGSWRGAAPLQTTPHPEILRRYGKSLLKDLKDCKDCTSENIVAVSAAIRHVFAHGLLTANANDMNPRAAHEIGTAVANFLFSMMDAEFTKTVEAYCAKKGIAPFRAASAAKPDLVGAEAL